jgi:hypothetical protein
MLAGFLGWSVTPKRVRFARSRTGRDSDLLALPWIDHLECTYPFRIEDSELEIGRIRIADTISSPLRGTALPLPGARLVHDSEIQLEWNVNARLVNDADVVFDTADGFEKSREAIPLIITIGDLQSKLQLFQVSRTYFEQQRDIFQDRRLMCISIDVITGNPGLRGPVTMAIRDFQCLQLELGENSAYAATASKYSLYLVERQHEVHAADVFQIQPRQS